MSLKEFVRESNRIEGIHRDPTDAEISAHRVLLALPGIAVSDLEDFVKVVQPDAVLRRRPGLNVRVGDHIAHDFDSPFDFANDPLRERT